MSTHYVERPSARGAVITVVVLVVGLVWSYLAADDAELNARTIWLIPAFGLVALPFFGLSYSKRRYYSITLTDHTLTVGRAHLPAQGLRVHPGPPPTGTPLLGGAYGAPMGWATVVVTGADGRNWRVATRRPEEFTRALAEVAADGR